MAKDERLYMKFVNDFHRHPKLRRLAPEVRWAFVEMVGESRIADNDGVFDADDAEFLWPSEILEALLKSHPSRPLVFRDEDGRYVIRDYEKHQQTKSDRETLSEKRSRAASERWARGKQADANASQVHSKQVQPHAESESESESELHRPTVTTESVSLSSNRAREDETDSEESREQAEASARLAAGRGLDLGRIISLADERCGRFIGNHDALRLAQHITDKSRVELKNPMAYVAGAFTRSPLEIQQWIDREVLP